MMKSIISSPLIKNIMHDDFCALQETMLVCEALDHIRNSESKPRILYFYVVDRSFHLSGVISTRMLLTADLNSSLGSIADHRVRYIPQEAEIQDVLAEFVVHKFLALPVVDKEHRLVGIVDVSSFTENVSDILERNKAGEIFETIGFRLNQIQGASPQKAFRIRFPWLIASITGGLLSAIMTSRFESVLAGALVLSFFLTLILGLGESISMQSMTVTIQALRTKPPSLKWFVHEFSKELFTALLLGLACGLTVGAAVFIWQRALLAAMVIGGSLVVTMLTANLTGLIIPTTLHALKLDPRIAEGPLTLTISDLFTISIYFSLAGLVL